MLYRINEKGRYEAVTADGKVIGFDDFAEMVDFAALRGEVCQLVGKKEAKGATQITAKGKNRGGNSAREIK